MLFLKHIQLYHFKNHKQAAWHFNKQVIAITGPNGSGKTSILDAIHALCMTKSYIQSVDSQCITFGEQDMSIIGNFEKNDHTFHVKCIVRNPGKKEFVVNQNAVGNMSKHIGLLPCVFIAPDDVELVLGGSEQRRKLLDTLICQLDKEYLQHLVKYNKVLVQRNALLKIWHECSTGEQSLIEIYDQQLIEVAAYIVQRRRDVMTLLSAATEEVYNQLCLSSEKIQVVYESKLIETSMELLLRNGREKDIASQRSNYGVHKDDIAFMLNNAPVKINASQGQRKSFLFSLKLALHKIMYEQFNLAPILLIDDIFEKLDQSRIERLIKLICEWKAQVFITDTHSGRILEAFTSVDDMLQHISLE